MASGQVLIISADERWRRVLEVTIRLGGAETITRHSVDEAVHITNVEGPGPTAIVVDLGAQTSASELDDVRQLVQANSLPTVVILPERLMAERAQLVAVGATVLVRPYRPSELYAALLEGGPVGPGVAAGVDEPLTVDEPPAVDAEPADGPLARGDTRARAKADRPTRRPPARKPRRPGIP